MTDFEKLLEYFHHIELPISFEPHHTHQLTEKNNTIPTDLAKVFLDENLTEEQEEYVELISFGRISLGNGCIGLVYWKADLMNYEYILVNLDKNGEILAKKRIGGTQYVEKRLLHTVATIEPNLSVSNETYQEQRPERILAAENWQIMENGEMMTIQIFKNNVI